MLREKEREGGASCVERKRERQREREIEGGAPYVVGIEIVREGGAPCVLR